MVPPAMAGNVHDALFKYTFSQVENAASMFRFLLPAALVKRIDFSTLALCPGSFVDEALSQRHSDLLFSAKIAGRDAFIYVLFEHQSSFDPLMPFRLLLYVVRVWEAHIKAHPDAKRLPVILPVLLHHSKAGWKAEPTFDGLLDADADLFQHIADYVPRFRFLLDDLSTQSDFALKGRALNAFVRLVFWSMKNGGSREKFKRSFPGWMDVVLEVLRAPNGSRALNVVWRYIFAVNERIPKDEMIALLARAAPAEVKEEIVNVADQLREEGRQQGLQQGLLEGRRELLLKQLSARFGSLPQTAVLRVNSADAGEIDQWAERILTAPSLADVLDTP
jgi:predicted transposase/invertase (TIGR01784 family)